MPWKVATLVKADGAEVGLGDVRRAFELLGRSRAPFQNVAVLHTRHSLRVTAAEDGTVILPSGFWKRGDAFADFASIAKLIVLLRIHNGKMVVAPLTKFTTAFPFRVTLARPTMKVIKDPELDCTSFVISYTALWFSSTHRAAMVSVEEDVLTGLRASTYEFVSEKRLGEIAFRLFLGLAECDPGPEHRELHECDKGIRELSPTFEATWAPGRASNRGIAPALDWGEAQIEVAHTLLLCAHSKYRFARLSDHVSANLGERGIWTTIAEFAIHRTE